LPGSSKPGALQLPWFVVLSLVVLLLVELLTNQGSSSAIAAEQATRLLLEPITKAKHMARCSSCLVYFLPGCMLEVKTILCLVVFLGFFPGR